MATFTGNFSGRSNHQLQLNVAHTGQSIEGNYSTVNWSLYVVRVSGTGSWSLDAHGSAAVNIGGSGWSRGGWAYDFRSASALLLGSGSFNLTHNVDGTRTFYSSASAVSGSTLGNASAGGNYTLPKIPRIPYAFQRWDGTAEVHATTAVRWDGTQEVPLTVAVRWDGTQEVSLL